MAIDTIKSTAVLDGSITSDDLSYPLTGFSSTGIDDNADATALTIDSSENVMVGKASVDTDLTGIELRANNLLASTRASAECLFLNRKTSDGDIAKFAKDGSAVGSIGNDSGNIKLDSAGGTGLLSTGGSIRYSWDADQFYPAVDNNKNLGAPSYRFKDAYLSGGVHLGGTDAAHKLDDYEEGSWTPTLRGSSGNPSGQNYNVRLGTYTKIGQMVHIQCYISVLSIGSGMGGTYGYISDFPFTIAPGSDAYSTGSFSYIHSLGQNVNSLHAYGNQGTNWAYATYQNGAGTTSSYLSPAGWGSTPTVMFSMTYITDS